MLSIDVTFLWILASFVVFMLLMKAMFFDAVARIKNARLQHLESDAAKAEQARQAAERHQQEWQARFAQAQQKSQALMAQARANATTQSQARVDAARTQAQQTVETSLASLAQWRADTLDALTPDRQALRDSLLNKLSQSSVSPVLSASAS